MNKIYLIAIEGAGLIEPGTENNIFWAPDDHAFRSLGYCIIWGSGIYTTLSDAKNALNYCKNIQKVDGHLFIAEFIVQFSGRV